MTDGSLEPAHWGTLYDHSTTSNAVDSTRSTDGRRASVTKPARKRSRASRKVPTTLLNTDTSNFRAMVQQFTGVPSAPYIPGGSSTISFGFGLDNPFQRTTAVLPSFGLHQPQFNNHRPPQQHQDIMGFPVNCENNEDEILHGMNSTRAAGRLPELLEGFLFDGIAGGVPPATEHVRDSGDLFSYTCAYN